MFRLPGGFISSIVSTFPILGKVFPFRLILQVVVGKFILYISSLFFGKVGEHVFRLVVESISHRALEEGSVEGSSGGELVMTLE